ncbi:hypothetical protein DFH29DRAFT_882000 [Suillus ampliporus]|nr:hypothetical protein DFH29DRAFT_882000 [Suillus ampliporus]
MTSQGHYVHKLPIKTEFEIQFRQRHPGRLSDYLFNVLPPKLPLPRHGRTDMMRYLTTCSPEILKDWIKLIDNNGWVAREQILGEEACSRVPAQFQTHTLFLVVSSPHSLWHTILSNIQLPIKHLYRPELWLGVSQDGFPSSLVNRRLRVYQLAIDVSHWSHLRNQIYFAANTSDRTKCHWLIRVTSALSLPGPMDLPVYIGCSKKFPAQKSLSAHAACCAKNKSLKLVDSVQRGSKKKHELDKTHGKKSKRAHSERAEVIQVGIDVEEQLDYGGMDVDHDMFEQVKNIAGPSNIPCPPSPPPVTSKRSGRTVHMPRHFVDYLPRSATHLAHMPPTLSPSPAPSSEPEDPRPALVPFQTEPDTMGLYSPEANLTLQGVTDAPTLDGERVNSGVHP